MTARPDDVAAVEFVLHGIPNADFGPLQKRLPVIAGQIITVLARDGLVITDKGAVEKARAEGYAAGQRKMQKRVADILLKLHLLGVLQRVRALPIIDLELEGEGR